MFRRKKKKAEMGQTSCAQCLLTPVLSQVWCETKPKLVLESENKTETSSRQKSVIFVPFFFFIWFQSASLSSPNVKIFFKSRYNAVGKKNKKKNSSAPLPSLPQRGKLSMRCNFGDHIVAFGSDSEWLSDIFNRLLRLYQLSPVCFLMSSLLTFYQLSDNGITGGRAPPSTGLQSYRWCLATGRSGRAKAEQTRLWFMPARHI